MVLPFRNIHNNDKSAVFENNGSDFEPYLSRAKIENQAIVYYIKINLFLLAFCYARACFEHLLSVRIACTHIFVDDIINKL